MLHMFHTYVAIVCSQCFICSSLPLQWFHVASCKCYIGMLHMSSHICCKCTFQMSHLFQMYVAFKCFMLHVFHVVRRVRGHGGAMAARHGRRGMGCGELVAGRHGARRARGWRLRIGRAGQTDGGEVRGWGRVESRWMGRIASESYGRVTARCAYEQGKLADVG